MRKTKTRTPKTIYFGQAAREKLLRGALQLAEAAAVTYGPCGRIVILERVAGNIATKDGATVVREISFRDPGMSMGAALLKEPCLAMSETVGDGTTTTAILAASLLKECHRYLVAGVNPMHLSKGLREAARAAIDLLHELAMPVESEHEVRSITLIASNGDTEIAQHLTKAVMSVGQKGTVTIEDGLGTETELVLRDGMSLEAGFVSPSCWPSSKEIREHFEQPFLALFDCGLYSFEDIRDVVEVASQWPHPLIIFAHTVEAGALATWVLNGKSSDGRPSWHGALVKCPGWGDHRRAFLDDIASLSGATVIDPKAGMDLHNLNPEWFGSVQTATVERNSTLLVGYADGVTTERVQKRVRCLQAEKERALHEYDQDRLQERISKLNGGLATLRVGGITESALQERRARIEDALGSVRAALAEGIVPGAGAAYLFAAQWLTAQDPPEGDASLGYLAFIHALQEPFRVLLRNAGQESSNALEKVDPMQGEECNPWMGWDVVQRKARLLYEEPMIVDATRVAVEAIRYVASAVGTIITTEVMVVRE